MAMTRSYGYEDSGFLANLNDYIGTLANSEGNFPEERRTVPKFYDNSSLEKRNIHQNKNKESYDAFTFKKQKILI